jgi:hypothetical protein
MNPPYDKKIDRWIRRMDEHGSGISLIFARTETSFWETEVWAKVKGVLFLSGRLFFHHPDGRRGDSNAGAPSALLAHSDFDVEVLRKSGIAGVLVTDREILTAREKDGTA